VPLHAQAHDALRRWYTARPAAATDALFVSLRIRQSAVAVPEPISAGAVGDIVAKRTAAAGAREDRRTAHALRHTFCMMLAERGVALEVIRALAGQVDVRATQIYVDVTDRCTADGISALERIPVRWRRSRLRGQTTADDGDHSSILAANDRPTTPIGVCAVLLDG
jgi:integrase